MIFQWTNHFTEFIDGNKKSVQLAFGPLIDPNDIKNRATAGQSVIRVRAANQFAVGQLIIKEIIRCKVVLQFDLFLQ